MAKPNNSNICYICGCILSPAESSIQADDTFTWDHLIPRALGGKDSVENRKPCCHRCNTLKGSTSWNKRLGIVLRAVRQAEKYCRVKRVVERTKGRAYEVYLTKNCILCVTFSGSTVNITTRDENATFSYNFVVAFRESMKNQGYSLVDNPAVVTTKCAFCGRKLSGSVVGGVPVCTSCFGKLSQTLSLIKKLGENIRKFK